MKKEMIVTALIFLTLSTAACGTVPRIAIQYPPQARIFLYPPLCETVELPTIPNNGVIYLQVYTSHDTNALYLEVNGQPIKDEFGNIIYNPKVAPQRLEIIPLFIEQQYSTCVITARAVNDYGAHTVYAAFIPVPTGKGHKTSAFGCTSVY